MMQGSEDRKRLCIVPIREVNNMSDRERTPEEYIERYARDYCNGNKEIARQHAIVKALIEEKNGKKA